MPNLSCYDCIHCDVCSGIGCCSFHCSDVSKCKFFKNKAEFVKVKHIEIIRDDLKWWLETNSEKGVVYIPEYVVKNMIAKMDGKGDAK